MRRKGETVGEKGGLQDQDVINWFFFLVSLLERFSQDPE